MKSLKLCSRLIKLNIMKQSIFPITLLYFITLFISYYITIAEFTKNKVDI